MTPTRGDRRHTNGNGAIYQMVTQNKADADSGHKRLRHDLEELERDLSQRIAVCETYGPRLVKLELTPIAADKVTFSWQIIVSIVVGSLAVAGAGLGLRSSIADLRVTVETMAKAQDAKAEAEKELQKERNDQLHEAISTVDKQQKLEAIDIQKLKDSITSLSNRR